MDRRRRAARTVALMSLFSMTDTRENVPVASFDGDGGDLISLIVGIDPVQDLHGYDNPWPAGGGKNLFNASTFATKTVNGVTCTNNGDGSFTLNGTATADVYFDIFNAQFKEAAGGTPLPTGSYRITGCPSGGSIQTYHMYITPSYTPDTGSGGTNINTTVTGGSIFVKSGYTCNNLVFLPMIRVSTNGDDTYAPYSNICPISGWTGANIHVSPTTDAEDGTTHSITFPSEAGTVYGGTLDVTTGKLTVKFIKVTINSVALWPNTTNPNGTAVYKFIEGTSHIVSSDKQPYMLSNIFKYGESGRTSASLYQYGGADGGNTTQTFILPSTITTTAEANQWFVDNPTECIFMLATPIEVDLTPTEINTLIGTNNIWADTGEIKYIEYNI